MLEILEAVKAWPLLVVALVVFGLAPGVVLRLIVLAFHSDDPRRTEILAELRVIPRWERPFWVAEQVEVAFFEGLVERLEWAATGRLIYRWRLDSGVKLNRSYPDSFWIPDDGAKATLTPGDTVKLMFTMKDGWTERMWVEVTHVGRRRLRGRLMNQPVGIPKLDAFAKITFRYGDVIDITKAGEPGSDNFDEDTATICGECANNHNEPEPEAGAA